MVRAGTMGIEHNGNTDFTVMIRSALWRDDAGYAWSGAEIVEESDAELEWIEIENKAKRVHSPGDRLMSQLAQVAIDQLVEWGIVDFVSVQVLQHLLRTRCKTPTGSVSHLS